MLVHLRVGIEALTIPKCAWWTSDDKPSPTYWLRIRESGCGFALAPYHWVEVPKMVCS